MAVASRKPGKLGLELVNHLIDQRPDQQSAIEKAWRVASGRLSQKWTDERLWLAAFDEVPSNENRFVELKNSVVTFYDRPSDPALARALRQLLQDLHLFSSGIILKTVREFTDTLAEELFLADPRFRASLLASDDPVMKEIAKRSTPLLPPQPAGEARRPAVAAPVQEPPAAPPSAEPITTPIADGKKAQARLKAYESYIAEEPGTREILRIQQLAEEHHPEREPDQVESGQEAVPASEPPADRVHFPASEEEIPASQPTEKEPSSGDTSTAEVDHSYLEGLGLYDPWVKEPEETPVETPAASPESSRRILPHRSRDAADEEPNPVEMQIREELASAEAEKEAKRKKSITKRLTRLFTRPLKAPQESKPASEPESIPLQASIKAEPKPVTGPLRLAPRPAEEETTPGARPDALDALRGELEVQPAQKAAGMTPLEKAPEPEEEIPLDLARFGLEPEAVRPEPTLEAAPDLSLNVTLVHEVEAETPAEATSEQEPEIPLDKARFGVEPEAVTLEPLSEAEAEYLESAQQYNVLAEIEPEEANPLDLARLEVEPEVIQTGPVPEAGAEIPLDMARFGETVGEPPAAEAIPEPASAEAETVPADVEPVDSESISVEPTVEIASIEADIPVETPAEAQMLELEPLDVIPPAEIVEPALETEAPVKTPAEPQVLELEPLEVIPPSEVVEPPLQVESAPIESEPEEVLPVPVKAPKRASRKGAKPGLKTRASQRKKVKPDARFVGREEDLKQLAAWLRKGKRPVVIGQDGSVNGAGGVGKTCLAREYAARFGSEYSGGVFCFNFADPELIPYQIAAEAAEAEARPLKMRLKQVLAEWQDNQRRLLILDNCEDPPLLAEWLPTTGSNRVLVISRKGEWNSEEAELLSLGLFDRAESLALLQGKLTGLTVNDKNLQALAAGLGDHPLALHMAAGFLKTVSPSLTVTEFMGELAATERPISHWIRNGKLPADSSDLFVGRVVKVCLDHLDEAQESEKFSRQLLQWLASCAPDENVPREFLYTLASESAFNGLDLEEALERLVSFSLVDETPAGQVSIHSVVAGFIRLFIPAQAAPEQVGQVLLSAAVEANQGQGSGSLLPLLSHLKYVTDRAIKGNGSPLVGRLANELGYYLERSADFSLAQEYYEQALTINHRTLGQVHPETAVCLNNLGHLLGRTGDYKNARIYYEEALEIRRKLLGSDHPDTARSLNNLGHLFQVMGEEKEALPCFEEALAIRRKALGDQHPETAVSLNNLGSLLGAMGNTALARSYYEQALAIRREVLGSDHPETAATQNDLGCLLQKAGEFGAARSYHEQALVIRRKTLGEEHPETARSLNSLGELMLARGSYKEARAYFEEALAIRRKVLGDEHLDTSATLNNLGITLQVMGDYPGAQQNLEQALTIRQKQEGQATLESALSLERLGTIALTGGDQAAAQRYFDEAVTIRKSLEAKAAPRLSRLGKRGRTIVASLFVLAFMLVGLGLLIPGPTPMTLNWNNLNPGSIPLLQPLKFFFRPTATLTPTLTSTPTITFTWTFTSTRTPTSTRYIIPVLPANTPTFTAILPTRTPTRTYYFWTNTFTPTNPPPPNNTPTFTPSLTPSPTPRTPIPPTDPPTPTESPTPRTPIPPTDTPEPPTATP